MRARLAAALLLCLLLGGCGGRSLYFLGQSFGRGQCERMPDEGQRAQCEGGANTSYDSYKRQTGG